MTENEKKKAEKEDNTKEDNDQQQKLVRQVNKTGQGFYTDAFSVLFKPNQFMLDLKQNVPSVYAENGKHKKQVVTFHKSIMMDPILAKKMSKILTDNVQKYEEKFGEIKINEEVEQKEDEPEEKPNLNYIG